MVMLRRIVLAAFLAIGFLAGLPPLLHAQTPIPGEPDTERRTRYTATAQTGPFAVGFDIYGDGTDYQNWVKVYVSGVEVTQSGNWTMASVSGSFSTLARPITNATITFTTAKTGTIDIVGARRPRRTSQFQESQPVTARSMNQVLTDLWMTERERWDYVPRTMLAPLGETIGWLPSAATRASSALGFDQSGNPIALSPYLGTGTMIGPNVAVDGHVVCFNGTGGQLAKDCGAGIGTVLSVGLSLPGIFAITGSPVTSVGTLTAALATQSANTLWAGPTTGSAAAPAFRALVGADLPNPSTSSLGGVQSKACLTSSWINAISTSGVPGCTTPAFSDISGTATNAQLATMAAATFKGNPTASTATPSDFTIQGLTPRGSPNSTLDKIPIYNNATGTLQYVTSADISASVSAGVVTWNGRNGTVLPTTGDYSFAQVSGTVSPTQGGFGANASTDAANSVRVADGSGNFITTAVFTLLNAACSNSVTRPACVFFMGYANPRWCGAVGNGVTNDSPAFTTCVANVIAIGGGELRVTPGNYCLFTGVTVSGGGAGSVRIVGASTYSTYLNACGHDTNVVFLNGFYATLENIGVYGKGIFDTVFGASQSAILLGSGCGSCKLSFVIGQGGKYALELNGSVEPRLENSAFGYAYGGAIAYLVGAPGAKFHTSSFDQSFPVMAFTPNTLTITNWAASTAYALGAVVNNGGYIMQASQAGTSAGSAPALKNYNNTITDGTVHWLFAGASGYAGIQIDSNSDEFLANKLDISGGYTYGINITNNFGAPTRLIHIIQTVIGGATDTLINARTGSDIFLVDNEIFGCMIVNCSGITFANAWSGKGKIIGNKLGQAGFGVNLSAGTDMIFTGNDMTSTTYGFFVAANMTDFIISTNTIGTSNTNPVYVTAGTSNYYNITNNILHGGVVTDGGTGAAKTVNWNN